MSKWICTNCGCIIDDCDLHKEVDREYIDGRCMGESVEYLCPCCHGDVEEAVQCEQCGEWFAESDLNGGVCEKCIRDLFEMEEVENVEEL